MQRQPEARDAFDRGRARKGRSASAFALVHPGRGGRAIAIKEAGIECIRSLAARGVSERTIASNLGITKKQFAAALESTPEVSAAFEAGRAELEKHAVENLIKLSDQGSVAATIFLCKNVAGYSDNGPVGKTNTTNVQIVLPGAMSRDQFLATTSVTVASDPEAQHD